MTTYESCDSCRFAGPSFNCQQHHCRRHAPTAEKTDRDYVHCRTHVPIWPIVMGGDWCGDYVRKPEVKP